MSGLTMMLFVWAALACVLIGLVIYRSILGNHEEDQLYLDRAEAALEREQMEVVRRINRVDPIIRWFAIAMGGLLMLIAAWWIYGGLSAPTAAY
jgi:hypothetical protein